MFLISRPDLESRSCLLAINGNWGRVASFKRRTCTKFDAEPVASNLRRRQVRAKALADNRQLLLCRPGSPALSMGENLNTGGTSARTTVSVRCGLESLTHRTTDLVSSIGIVGSPDGTCRSAERGFIGA